MCLIEWKTIFRFLFFELGVIFSNNLKNKKLKIDFSFDSALGASFMYILSLLREGGGEVCMSLVEKHLCTFHRFQIKRKLFLGKFTAPIFPLNLFMPTVPTFALRETDVSRTANVGTVGKNRLRKRNGGQKWVKRQIQAVVARDVKWEIGAVFPVLSLTLK